MFIYLYTIYHNCLFYMVLYYLGLQVKANANLFDKRKFRFVLRCTVQTMSWKLSYSHSKFVHRAICKFVTFPAGHMSFFQYFFFWLIFIFALFLSPIFSLCLYFVFVILALQFFILYFISFLVWLALRSGCLFGLAAC